MSQEHKRVVLTGGGTVGHVILNKLLIPELINKNIEPVYIGSKTGIEKEVISTTGITYKQISSGKLRRYFSLENAVDVFRVMKGVFDARRILKKVKPEFVFSKGGFVTVPVVLAAKSLNIPVYIHESDITPGLANKIAGKFASKIFVTFEKTMQYVDNSKAEYIGPVIRDELKRGSESVGYELTGFNSSKETILIIGGSLGAKHINKFVRENLDELTKDYQVIHITGQNNIDHSIETCHYKQFEFVKSELAHLLSISDTVISRSGSNAIYEFLALRKPMILIPLPLSQSRGDQIENATYFEEQGFAIKLDEDDLTMDTLKNALIKINKERQSYVDRMDNFDVGITSLELVEKLVSEE
ncbi:undecaprenyldiphospho-muramoylpentapeptide beta-N-acetylglucosaminyltransferase [Phocicoccus pinnipedialis]|uniref:UDP-N-acetylglucosamine--N-acetylmuramyl-(pentapeptide) pyrophosphoryl-undecaprenol N-acetylglucosamine transferase n=1 Tax=Phocicoccus pinnipedialis TaxID=110845 RepID=A0A6V7REB9_9BACL|nr:undecaprenyldiphospho-muramoylpentapeptide beta-N-acetylglucosaminyltransferase [Jeotgalicoccus pinnipedialis]MBP1939409.1 UDP-N-acetylglucosamine--N-acetylmuramyl-(pentapeptide) pyrophosphoryl-undecaprenol N-acetylglucosamine transferase [Jeotgalicoccus pinnipedialis]CAD2075492.1 UDP-N-acetylglucosamine--N-acetylmuramyl-(pentapeptide) pyrophosphoryl-undecaprenol N-acetylglucosamine transferase [Jeotgalicoccus pinnipedialis]